MTRWVGISVAATRLGVSRWTLWRLAVKKRLVEFRRIGAVVQISMDSLEDYIAGQSRAAPAAPDSAKESR